MIYRGFPHAAARLCHAFADTLFSHIAPAAEHACAASGGVYARSSAPAPRADTFARMPRPRIYVETTIPSAYHTDRTDPASLERRSTTRVWWNTAFHSWDMVTSDVVLQELAQGRPEQARLRLALARSLRVLRSGKGELATALTYVRLKVMPGNPLADALHLAIASHRRCDALVTWNYHHLANHHKLDRIKKVNEELGLSVPRILTPKQLLEDR